MFRLFVIAVLASSTCDERVPLLLPRMGSCGGAGMGSLMCATVTTGVTLGVLEDVAAELLAELEAAPG